MKRRLSKARVWLAIMLLACAAVLRAADYTVETIPNTRLANRLNHVSDPDDIIAPTDEARINRALNLLEDSLGIEVAVVAVGGIGDNDARMFATDLFKHWGLGKKGQDNGLLIQLVTEPSQRSVVFETGYGLEGTLPDAICYRLQQRYMMEDLRAGRYSEAMAKGAEAVSAYLLASDYERADIAGTRRGNDQSIPMWSLALFMIIAIAIVTWAGYRKYRPRRCPRCGKRTFVYMGRQVTREATAFSEGLEEDIYRCKSCGYTERHNHTTDRLDSGGGPIIFGGGFGGFGGFGGGGDSGGSWGGGESGGGGSISRF